MHKVSNLQGLVAALVLASLTIPCVAFEQGDWIVRGGVGFIAPNDDSGALSGVAGSSVAVDNAATFAFTAGYMFTDRFSLELLGIWPASHTVEGQGSLPGLGVREVAEVDVFPPTLSLNYYFMPGSKFRPHLGVGVNYTTYFDVETSAQTRAVLGPRSTVSVDDSFGWAINAGVDYQIDDTFFVGAGLWYVDMSADADITGTALGNLSVDIDVDPLVFMLGAGMRF